MIIYTALTELPKLYFSSKEMLEIIFWMHSQTFLRIGEVTQWLSVFQLKNKMRACKHVYTLNRLHWVAFSLGKEKR